MSDKPVRERFFSMILLLLLGMVFSACSGLGSKASETDAQPQSGSSDAVVYKEFTLPGPVAMRFELPEEWDWWGNGGNLSPNDGKTLAGVAFVWIKEGQDAESLLYNEGATVLDKSDVKIGELETHRYIVEEVFKNAATGEIFDRRFRMIYAFPSPEGDMMVGVFVSDTSAEELEALSAVAEHMVSSLQWED
jgi:hypothetical protein